MLDADDGVIETDKPVISVKVDDVVENVFVLVVLTTCNTEPAGNLAAANVPEEIFDAFKDVSDAPEPDGESTSVPITNPKDVLAADAEVAAVPPFAIGNAVPDKLIANVPLVVIGEPVTDKNAGTVAATLVTVPVAVEAIEIEPLPFVIDIPVPAVNVAFVSVFPVVLPIRSCPSV